MKPVALAALVALGMLTATASLAGDVDDAKWLRLELREDASPLDALALAPAREQELRGANIGYVDLLLRFDTRLRADGNQEQTFTQVRRFLSDAGVEEGGELQSWAMPSHENLVVERAYVLRPDAPRVSIDPQTVQIVPDLEPRVFSDVRKIVVPLPGLTRDASAVFVYRRVFRGKDWPLPSANRFMLRSFHPVEQLRVEYSWDPQVEPPRWATDDDTLACSSSEHGFTCAKERIDALPVDPDLRSYYDETPELIVAEKLSWTQVATRVRDVAEAKISQGLPAGTLARVVGNAATPEERWRRIFAFVANEIRYLGLEHGSSAVVPRPPAVTLQRRFGDCKDKVSLLLALAREAGIDAYAVLASTENFDPSRLHLPTSGYFNHMIACRDTADGQRECVDPTVAWVAPEETTVALGGAVTLELREQTRQPGQLARPEYASEVEIHGETEIACDGSRKTKVERRLHGLAGINYRQSLEELSPDERKRMLADEYRQIVSLVVKPSFQIEGLREPGADLVISTEAATPPSTPLSQSPAIDDSDPWTVFYGITLRSNNQHFSYLNPGVRVRSTLRYDLCDGLVPKFFGAELALRSRYGQFARIYAPGPSSVIVSSTLEVPSGRLPPAEIGAFNRFLETALDQADIWFRLDER